MSPSLSGAEGRAASVARRPAHSPLTLTLSTPSPLFTPLISPLRRPPSLALDPPLTHTIPLASAPSKNTRTMTFWTWHPAPGERVAGGARVKKGLTMRSPTRVRYLPPPPPPLSQRPMNASTSTTNLPCALRSDTLCPAPSNITPSTCAPPPARAASAQRSRRTGWISAAEGTHSSCAEQRARRGV